MAYNLSKVSDERQNRSLDTLFLLAAENIRWKTGRAHSSCAELLEKRLSALKIRALSRF